MLSPIQTRNHYLKKIIFETSKPTPDADGENSLNFSLRHWKCKDHWHAELTVSFGAKEEEESVYPYTGEVCVEGLFDIHGDFPEDKVEDLVRMNGGAILYGSIREIIALHSSRSKYGNFELPTIDARMFVNLGKKENLTDSKSATTS